MTTLTGVLKVQADGAFNIIFDQSFTIVPGQPFDITMRQRPDMQAMRRLRLHHWREVCRLSDRLSIGHGTAATQQRWRDEHGLHMRAVQTLNDLFPLGDTAERDDKEMR